MSSVNNTSLNNTSLAPYANSFQIPSESFLPASTTENIGRTLLGQLRESATSAQKKEEAPIPAEKLEEFMQTKANLEKKIAELHGQIIRVNTQLISKDLSERHCIKTMDWLEKQASNLEATAMTASQRLAEKMQETAFQTQQIMYRDMHIHSLAGHLGVTVGQILPHQQHEIHALNQHLQSAHGTIQDQAEEIHKLRQQLQETTQPVRASHSKIEQIHEALPTRRFSTSFERLTVNMAEVTSRDLTPFDEICESFGRSPSDFGGTVYCKMIFKYLIEKKL